ncbi:hypothetical protein SAY86_010255 [Trapa natans]|uniref:Xylanase inhibitor C-terminal domain-containing protein n=1 Tax=Trapa natans TaxID=22666 RepID=A0AAN7KYD2_TRANT|nr:hypothetical protein SAY86_010255 [Trapa natans]
MAVGVIASETMVFETTDEGQAPLGGKFSHCFGDLRNPKYEYNMLLFGDGAILEGDVTPIETHLVFYYVTLVGISVGEEKLDIDPSVFRLGLRGEGGVLVDSGSTFTTMVKGAMFLQMEKDLLCMAVVPSGKKRDSLTIIGNLDVFPEG